MSTDLNPDERALHDLLDSSMRGVLAPGDAETRARRAGRSIKARRRARVAALGVAAALAVAVPVAINSGGSTPGDNTSVAADPSKDAQPEPAAEWWTMPASDMAAALSDRLPEGVTLSHPELTNADRAPGEPQMEPQGYLVARLTGPDGPSKVNLVLDPPVEREWSATGRDGLPSEATESDSVPADDDPVMMTGPSGPERYSCDPMWVNEPDSCTVIKDEDGTVIGRVLDLTVGGVRALGITLVTPDGGTVMVDIANTLDDKWPHGATPSSERLPLTLAQLRAIAEDPIWTSYVP